MKKNMSYVMNKTNISLLLQHYYYMEFVYELGKLLKVSSLRLSFGRVRWIDLSGLNDLSFFLCHLKIVNPLT